MSEAEFKTTAAFFKEWSPAMLAKFYEFERNDLGEEYLSIEDVYFKEHSEEEQIVRFLVKNKELWNAITAMLRAFKLEPAVLGDEEGFLLEYIGHLPKHCKVILVALSRGFLLEWLFFYMGIGNYANVLEEGEKISDDYEYDKWKREFRRLSICRAEMVVKYANYASYYFYYRVLNLRVWNCVFDWAHSKGIRDDFKDELVDMFIDMFRNCKGLEILRKSYVKRCRDNGWIPILPTPKLPLPEEIDTENAQYYFRKAIDSGLMEMEGTKFKWKGQTKVLLVYFLSRVYCGDCTQSECWSKGVDPVTSEDVSFTNTKILEEIFEEKNIDVTRRKGLYKPSPKGFEKVDKLFEE